MASAPAKADTIDFTFTSLDQTDGFDVTGVAYTDASNMVTSLTGAAVGFGSATGDGGLLALIPVGTPGYGAWLWDNVFSQTPYYFTNSNSSGILFTIDGDNVGNLYLAQDTTSIYLSVSNPATFQNPGDLGTLAVASVPEPATWAMMLASRVGFPAVAGQGPCPARRRLIGNRNRSFERPPRGGLSVGRPYASRLRGPDFAPE